MGHHFVPRYYLKGFCENPDNKIWVHSKDKKPFFTNIINVAHETDLYSDAIEKWLSEKIEDPANHVLDKVLRKWLITANEKIIFSRYITELLARVPKSLSRWQEFVKMNSDRVFEDVKKEIINRSLTKQYTSEIKNQLNSLEELRQKYKADPPKDSWYSFIIQEGNARLITAIANMRWTFIYSKSYDYFISCDNPVFLFHEVGIAGSEKSELTFPLSSKIALLANWSEGKTCFRDGSSYEIQQINKRTLSNAKKYIYSAQNFDWIDILLNKKKLMLRFFPHRNTTRVEYFIFKSRNTINKNG